MSKQTETDNPGPSNFFISTLTDLAQGDLAPMLSEDLANLVKEVRDQQNKGSLTLKLTIKPAGGDGKVEVQSDVDLKLPKPDPGLSLFFSTEHGQLLRRNPNQRELPFKDNPNAQDSPRRASGQ